MLCEIYILMIASVASSNDSACAYRGNSGEMHSHYNIFVSLHIFDKDFYSVYTWFHVIQYN